MKRAVIALSIAMTTLLALNAKTLMYKYFFASITPGHSFDRTKLPPTPDYTKRNSWHALPEGEEGGKVDVFFLHPTTFKSPDNWNRDIYTVDNSESMLWIKRNITEVFEDCCRLFVPHYREATLAAYWEIENGKQARQLAYEDTQKAFEYYIEHENQGRPFILAGHSQGSEMGIRLIQDKILNKDIFQRMIAAYIIGISIPSNEMAKTHPGLEVCQNASQTHCLINWTTFRREEHESDYFHMGPNGWWKAEGYQSGDFDKYVCVNPLNWKSHSGFVPKEKHLGMRIHQRDGSVIERDQQTNAECSFARLMVSDLNDYLPVPLEGNYHMYDYAIFFENIKTNLKTRINAFQEQNHIAH